MMVVRSDRQRYFTLIIMASPYFFYYFVIRIVLYIVYMMSVILRFYWPERAKHIAEYYDDGTQKETISSVTFNDRYQSKYA